MGIPALRRAFAISFSLQPPLLPKCEGVQAHSPPLVIRTPSPRTLTLRGEGWGGGPLVPAGHDGVYCLQVQTHLSRTVPLCIRREPPGAALTGCVSSLLLAAMCTES